MLEPAQETAKIYQPCGARRAGRGRHVIAVCRSADLLQRPKTLRAGRAACRARATGDRGVQVGEPAAKPINRTARGAQGAGGR